MNVSVIVPCYNSARFMRDAIDSVLMQGVDGTECIIVDDGSTDDTQKIAEAYGKQIKYYWQYNSGVASARNTGIRKSSGEFVAFLDSDDVWCERKLERQLALMKRSDGLGICYGDYSTVDSHGKVISENQVDHKAWPRPVGDVFENLFERCFLQTSTVVVRRDALEETGFFDESFRIGEDYHLWLRLADKYRFGRIDGVVAKYRVSEGSLSHAGNATFTRPWECRVLEDILRSMPWRHAQVGGKRLKNRMARPYFDLGYKYFYEQSYDLAAKYFFACLRRRPLDERAIAYYIMARCIPGYILNGFVRGKEQEL